MIEPQGQLEILAGCCEAAFQILSTSKAISAISLRSSKRPLEVAKDQRSYSSADEAITTTTIEHPVAVNDPGITTNDRGLLARFSVHPLVFPTSMGPIVPGQIYRPLGGLVLSDPVDVLLADLWQGAIGISTKSPLRSSIEDVVRNDQLTLICPFHVGYRAGNDAAYDSSASSNSGTELTLLFLVRIGSMTVQRAIAVVNDTRNVLARYVLVP